MSEESTTGSVMHCTECGSPLTEGDRFCANCGHPTTPAPADLSDESASTQTSSSRRTFLVVAAIVAVLVVAGVVAGSIVMAQNRAAAASAAERQARAQELRKVYETVAAIDSATSVGINFGDYSAKVQDAQAALDAYTPPDGQAQDVATDLSNAMAQYKLAASYWNGQLQSTYGTVDNDTLSGYWSTASDSMISARGKLEAYEAK